MVLQAPNLQQQILDGLHEVRQNQAAILQQVILPYFPAFSNYYSKGDCYSMVHALILAM